MRMIDYHEKCYKISLTFLHVKWWIGTIAFLLYHFILTNFDRVNGLARRVCIIKWWIRTLQTSSSYTFGYIGYIFSFNYFVVFYNNTISKPNLPKSTFICISFMLITTTKTFESTLCLLCWCLKTLFLELLMLGLALLWSFLI